MFYRGIQSSSESGMACLAWWPEFAGDGSPNVTVIDAQNFCRNVGIFGMFGYTHSTERPLCTVYYDQDGPRWQFCDIPLCSDVMVTQIPTYSPTSSSLCKLFGMRQSCVGTDWLSVGISWWNPSSLYVWFLAKYFLMNYPAILVQYSRYTIYY